MATKRTINKRKFSVPDLVDRALGAVEGATLDLDRARTALRMLGHSDPADDLVMRYARESAILDYLARETGANFSGQIGKISFTSREKAINDVGDYLDRRNQGRRARWTASHKR